AHSDTQRIGIVVELGAGTDGQVLVEVITAAEREARVAAAVEIDVLEACLELHGIVDARANTGAEAETVVVQGRVTGLELGVDVRKLPDEVELVGEAVHVGPAELDRAAVDAEVEILVLPLAENEKLIVELVRTRDLEAVAIHVEG